MQILPSASPGLAFLHLSHPGPVSRRGQRGSVSLLGSWSSSGGSAHPSPPGAALPPPGAQLRNSLKCWHLVAARENNISLPLREIPGCFGCRWIGMEFWGAKRRVGCVCAGRRGDVGVLLLSPPYSCSSPVPVRGCGSQTTSFPDGFGSPFFLPAIFCPAFGLWAGRLCQSAKELRPHETFSLILKISLI